MNVEGRKKWFLLLSLIAVFSVAVRLLIHYEFHTSALLYVGLPVAISLSLIYFADETHQVSWTVRYWRHFRWALIIMLGSSVILFEGFLCVLMFMPIYFAVFFSVFLFESIYRQLSGKSGRTLPLHIFPLLIVISSFEGVTPKLSFERYTEVSTSKIIDLDIAQIKRNLQKPISLGEDLPGFLRLFPMPYQVQAETLQEGDIHRSEFRYHRWFFTNTHEGHLSIKLAEIGKDFIRTEVVENTSYLSSYLSLHGTLIELEPAGADTKVTLTVSYDRKLDPAWYFGPLERFAVTQMAAYLIDKIIHRDGGVQNG